ncbi:hypothetical protein [Orenia marismortui]|uniref:Uncharacterized protein n=1 Tax=Orenia marismortui TaxID=46469 RepID=A0A4R8GSK6_9FIRM|nr:hypothetical protein [Orenia marismortui]TDX48925.1 hypothetical protein C7959_12436 [Orenia marismortui]
MNELLVPLGSILFLICSLAIIIGLINPNLVIWAGKKTRGQVLKYYGMTIIVIPIISGVINAVIKDGISVLFAFLILLCSLGIIIGLINPNLVIKKEGNKTRLMVLKYYGIVLIVLFIIFACMQ